MALNTIYSLRSPIASTFVWNSSFQINGLDSPENDLFNTGVVSLVSFGQVALGKNFRNFENEMSFNEIHIVRKGTGHVRYDKKDFFLTPGNAYFFPAGGAMDVYDNNALEKYFFQFHVRLNGCEVLHGLKPLEVRTPRSVSAELLIRRLIASRAPQVLAARACVLSYLDLFAKDLTRTLRHRIAIYRRYESFFRYMNDHLNSDFSLARYAAHTGQKAKNFAAAFKKQYGESPKKLFLREKISRIRESLGFSDTPIGDISDAFGFRDPYYFSHFFKKMTGVTPSRYRSNQVSPNLSDNDPRRFKSL